MTTKTEYYLEWALAILLLPITAVYIFVYWSGHRYMTSAYHTIKPIKMTYRGFMEKYTSVKTFKVQYEYRTSLFAKGVYLHASIIEFDSTRFIVSPISLFFIEKEIKRKARALRHTSKHPSLTNELT